MHKWLWIAFGLLAASGVFFIVFSSRTLDVQGGAAMIGSATSSLSGTSDSPEAARGTSTAILSLFNEFGDIENQAPLPNPPQEVKAIYLTGWSAGSAKKVASTIALIKRTELNAVVVDIKDYSGFVAYKMDIPMVREIGADREIRITRPNAMLKEFHDNGIYVIGRITVFQDPILAAAHPEWALGLASSTKTWKDHKGIAWMDAAGKPTWDYNIAIAKDARARGFDEINFDYVRFASDGELNRITYPFWDQKSSRSSIIRSFFKYLRQELSGIPTSADLFGLATINRDDLGIGQVIEDAYQYFDFVAPMVYPSHYAKGFIGIQNPAAHPYEVMKYSLDRARERWEALAVKLAASTSTEAIAESRTNLGKIRPWIQDFDLGATYTPQMVRSEFQATYDALLATSSRESYGGWYIWDPSNTYTEAALLKE